MTRDFNSYHIFIGFSHVLILDIDDLYFLLIRLAGIHLLLIFSIF